MWRVDYPPKYEIRGLLVPLHSLYYAANILLFFILHNIYKYFFAIKHRFSTP